jgi:hypothetical protein
MNSRISQRRSKRMFSKGDVGARLQRLRSSFDGAAFHPWRPPPERVLLLSCTTFGLAAVGEITPQSIASNDIEGVVDQALAALPADARHAAARWPVVEILAGCAGVGLGLALWGGRRKTSVARRLAPTRRVPAWLSEWRPGIPKQTRGSATSVLSPERES